MPAASAEKRARQRANKLKPSATIQSTGSTSIQQTSASPPSAFMDFETFVELANLDDIIRFCNTVASTQEGRNLKSLWDRAFEAGLDQGRTEERDFRDEMYCRGKAQGIKEAEEAASRAEIDLYYHGTEKGKTEERSEWTSAGHGPHCFAPTAVLSDEIIQTDSEPSITTVTCDANIQTPAPSTAKPTNEPPALPTTTDSSQPPAVPEHKKSAPLRAVFEPQQPVGSPAPTTIVSASETRSQMADSTKKHEKIEKTSIFTPKSLEPPVSMCFSWADDAAGLPIVTTAPTKHPRDISSLRSSSKNPFSSLRRRRQQPQNSHHFINFRTQLNCQHTISNPHYHISTPRLPRRSSQPPFAVSLDWDQDPRLVDLNNALTALGWIQPRRGRRL
jgi:hypothetical protein